MKSASGTQELWSTVAGVEVASAAAALAQLADARQTPTPQQAALLLDAVERPGAPPALLLPALALLSCWAKQQGLQPADGRDTQLLHRASAAGRALLGSTSSAPPPDQPTLAASCLLLLSSVTAAAGQPGLGAEAAEVVGGALLDGRLGRPVPGTAADGMAAVGALLPCLEGTPVAACWLLAALLGWLGGWAPPADQPPCVALDCLAPAYALGRGAAMAAIRRSSAPAAVHGLLRPAYAVLRDAAPATSAAAIDSSGRLVQGAVAVLALGGLAEGLLRAAAGFPEAAQLAAEAESSLAAACAAAAAPEAAAGMVGHSQPAQALLLDACALASAQLCAAVQRPQLTAASARCQVQALLHSALSLAPLHQAAMSTMPPAQASALLQRQAGCALVQQAAGIATRLSALYSQLPGKEQHWLVQQVQLAARQAHAHYRQLALSASPAWLAGVDAAAVRQLLDKLFLACLVLLVAAWQAAAAPPPAEPAKHSAAVVAAAADGQRQEVERAQLAAIVVGVLAELQFCRVGTAQYAALLRAALAEAPSDPAAAASLAACLPCYADVAVQCPTHAGQAAWLVDAVSAAKVQLLFNALVPCCGMLPLVTLEERLAPLAFLYLLHPHRPAAAAAHQLFCALLVALPEQRREPLAAYYVQRSLEGCPAGSPPPPELGQGLATVLASLPLGSPVALLCLQPVLEACSMLAARGDPAAGTLAALAAQSLLLVEHSQLDSAMAACGEMLGGGMPVGAVLRRALQAALVHSDDCVRKPALAAWLLRGAG